MPSDLVFYNTRVTASGATTAKQTTGVIEMKLMERGFDELIGRFVLVLVLVLVLVIVLVSVLEAFKPLSQPRTSTSTTTRTIQNPLFGLI